MSDEAPATRNILTLDGGGVRGIITLAFLERLQSMIDPTGGKRLCDHFQMIGGTSTGSIIAAGLSLGLSPKTLLEFYTRLGPRVFRKPRFRIIGMQSVFDAQMLPQHLHIADQVPGRILADFGMRRASPRAALIRQDDPIVAGIEEPPVSR